MCISALHFKVFHITFIIIFLESVILCCCPWIELWVIYAVAHILFKKKVWASIIQTLSLIKGTSLRVQWSRLRASTARGTGSVPGGEAKIPPCFMVRSRNKYFKYVWNSECPQLAIGSCSKNLQSPFWSLGDTSQKLFWNSSLVSTLATQSQFNP